MIYLMCFFVACLLGRGALRALSLYRKSLAQEFSFADSVLTGGMMIIGLAEAAHLGAVILGRSFSDCVKWFLVGCVALLILAVVLVVAEHYRKKKNSTFAREAERLKVKKAMTADSHQLENKVIFFVFGTFALIQLLLVVTGQKIYLTGDMTVETVNSILTTDAIYQVNPLTGQAYTLGIPMRVKILCLPTLYAILCDVFGMGAAQVVWTVMPVFTLIGSYLAFYTVAKALFPFDTKKRGIFMVLVALLLWVSDYMYGMEGFAVQYAGFRGVSIRVAILLPYTFGLVLRKKWKLVVLCILAEACIVWTLYGMGACLLVTAVMLLTGMIQKKLQAGEEGDL